MQKYFKHLLPSLISILWDRKVSKWRKWFTPTRESKIINYLERKVHKRTTSPSYSSLAQFETTEVVIALLWKVLSWANRCHWKHSKQLLNIYLSNAFVEEQDHLIRKLDWILAHWSQWESTTHSTGLIFRFPKDCLAAETSKSPSVCCCRVSLSSIHFLHAEAKFSCVGHWVF